MVREMDFVDECYADKDLSLLKKLTLVIPTYNRNYYLNRCLWYHAHFPFGQIIVADSSPEEKKVVNRETVSKIREMLGVDVLYLEYEPETEKYGGDIYRKWGDAVMHVETEYSQICTDKEFLLPITLTRFIEYLECHQGYVTVDATHYNLSKENEYLCYNIPTMNLDSDDSYVRFSEMASNPGCTLLALYKTNILKSIYTSYITHRIQDIRFGELYLEILAAIKGKIITIPDNTPSYRDTTSFTIGNIDQMKTERKFIVQVFINMGISLRNIFTVLSFV